MVPISALIQNPDGSMAVASVVNNTVKYIPVKTGVESDIEAEIIPDEEGALTEGLQLIEAPSPMITDGMTVHVLPSQQ